VRFLHDIFLSISVTMIVSQLVFVLVCDSIVHRYLTLNSVAISQLVSLLHAAHQVALLR
jgi:hypothetical protein